MAEVGHRLVWMRWQSIQIVSVSACVVFILHQKIQKMAKCTFWYQLTRVISVKVQRAVKWLCVYVLLPLCPCFIVPLTYDINMFIIVIIVINIIITHIGVFFN